MTIHSWLIKEITSEKLPSIETVKSEDCPDKLTSVTFAPKVILFPAVTENVDPPVLSAVIIGNGGALLKTKGLKPGKVNSILSEKPSPSVSWEFGFVSEVLIS